MSNMSPSIAITILDKHPMVRDVLNIKQDTTY